MRPNGFDLEPVIENLADRISERIVRRLADDGLGLNSAVKPRLLTVDQAAAYLGRTKAAVQHMVTSGKLPSVRSDRRVFIDVRDLDEWIGENKLKAAA